MKIKIWYIIYFLQKKARKKNHFGMKWNEIFARKIQPKHETQSPFSDETRNLIHYPLFSKKSAQDFSFHFIPNLKTLREKFSQNMKHKPLFQMKLKIRYTIHFFRKKARKIFHSKIIPNPKPCAKNSAKTWNINRFFRFLFFYDT